MKPDISLATKTGHFNLLPTPQCYATHAQSTFEAPKRKEDKFLTLLSRLCNAAPSVSRFARETSMVVRLVDSLSTTPKMAALFSDESILQAMLAFEVGLARAEASLGIVPATALPAIENAANPEFYETTQIAAASFRSGTITIPLVKALTGQVREIDASAAGFVHWGATSQDVADTAIVLLLKQAREILHSDLSQLESALYRLSEDHVSTVMLSRTLLQAALPTTFGLKVAGWLGAVRRDHARLDDAFEEALILQFGGLAEH